MTNNSVGFILRCDLLLSVKCHQTNQKPRLYGTYATFALSVNALLTVLYIRDINVVFTIVNTDNRCNMNMFEQA